MAKKAAKKTTKAKSAPKKKKEPEAQQPDPAMAMPGQMPMQGMPGQVPGQMPGQMPGMMPQQAGGNPMMQMMQMMQMMMGGGQGGGGMNFDPSAMPFRGGELVDDPDAGLDSDIIRPSLLENRIKQQHAIELGSVLDHLCLNEEGTHSLGGVPKGCTIALAGPPGKGKTRTMLAGMARVAAAGDRVAFVVAEEGFHNDDNEGRDDLCSRLMKVGMDATGLNEKDFEKKVLDNFYVLESQYHKGQTWDEFVSKYRYLTEKENIRFVVIDSLNMLDPTRNRTADNLSALKTYNHEMGITCICIGQIRDTGMPVGGEALQHTADVVFLIEEFSLGSKEIAELWGGKYRDKVDIIRAVKSVTTPIFPHPIKLGREASTGLLIIDEGQPDIYKVPEKA